MSILNAAVSGMAAEANWLSTIAQNVANANTKGYKSSETEFSTLVDRASVVANDTGDGVMTSIRSMNSAQGAIVSGSSITDMAVQGSGFFVVSDAGGATFLTRAGSFVPDASGNLVNAAGYYLMGYNVQNGPPTISANSTAGMQKVNISASGVRATATTSGTFSANLDSTAPMVAAGNLPSANSATATYTEKTSLVTYNNLGGTQTVDLYMTKTGPDTWEIAAYDNSLAGAGGGFPYSSAPIATQTLNFSASNGQLTSGTPMAIPIPNGQNMSLDLSGMTQLSSAFAISTASTNGNAAASMTGVVIGTDGKLSFNYANGTAAAGYLIPLATVASPENLSSNNGDVFQATIKSGAETIGTAGKAGLGLIESSSLENSTVDLATELTQMIAAQSAYQSNSKVFQTGADLISILNNLKA